jgi:hypothetical protein
LSPVLIVEGILAMALQNKVDPAGNIKASQMRGQLMGNRGGRFHDPLTRTLLPKRRWASRQWICCVTEFKLRHRTVMSNSYTELFFLDEVSAFSAGHRPCYECRRKPATSFAGYWAEAKQLDRPPKAGEMDLILHKQRLKERDKRISVAMSDELPDGAMIRMDTGYFAKREGKWHKWSVTGYQDSIEFANRTVQLLTPPAIVGVLNSGYKPEWY